MKQQTNVDIKVNRKKVVEVGTGEFYPLKKGEEITGRRFIGFKQFSKV